MTGLRQPSIGLTLMPPEDLRPLAYRSIALTAPSPEAMERDCADYRARQIAAAPGPRWCEFKGWGLSKVQSVDQRMRPASGDLASR
jgi:hypothetical protein